MKGNGKAVDLNAVAFTVAQMIDLCFPRGAKDFFSPDLLDLAGRSVSRMVKQVVEHVAA